MRSAPATSTVPEVQAVGQQHEVAGEAVAADVRALPHLVGPARLAQRPHERTAERRAARIVATVRAHEHVASVVALPARRRARGRRPATPWPPRPRAGRRSPAATRRPRGRPGRGAPHVDEHEAVAVVLLVAARGRGGRRSRRMPLALHRLAPDQRGVRTELAVDDGVAAPRAVDLDEQPRRHLRRRRRDRLVRARVPRRRTRTAPLALSQGRPPLRRRGAAPTTSRDASSRLDVESAERERSGGCAGWRRAGRPASAGIVSARSPRPSSTRSPAGVSHSSGPGVTDEPASSSPIVGGCSGRSRVAGWRRHTSWAIHRRSASGSRCGDERLQAGPATDVDGDRLAQVAGSATASSTAWRTAWCQVGAITPIVRCDDADVDGLGGVREATRQVEAVAGLQREVQRRLAELVERRHRLARPRAHGVPGALQRLPHPPALAPVELQHEHVVEVEVQLEALRRRRREVGVDLHGVTEVERQVVGQSGRGGDR